MAGPSLAVMPVVARVTARRGRSVAAASGQPPAPGRWLDPSPAGLVLAQSLGLAARGLVNIAKSEVGVAVRLLQAEGGAKVARRLLPQRPGEY